MSFGNSHTESNEYIPHVHKGKGKRDASDYYTNDTATQNSNGIKEKMQVEKLERDQILISHISLLDNCITIS